MKLLTAEIARDLLDYDIDTGLLTRRKAPNRRRAGSVLGTPNKKGYLCAYIHDTTYLLHRVIWLMVCDRWPTDQIDHVNGIRDDNRLENLRECTNAENRQNIRPEGYGQSGFLGVSPSNNGWSANITLHGKTEHLGWFADKLSAHKAYVAAKERHHSFVASDIDRFAIGG